MTQIASGLNTANRGCFAQANGQVYFTNNFDAVKVWDGIDSAARDAGITGPAAQIGAPSTAAGNCSNGDHRFRYRFRNSRTGYVSNPSPERTVTVSGGNGQLTFDIGTSGTDLIRSTDAKVDLIDLEMTGVNGQTWYRVATVANSATSVVASMADTSLIQQFNVDANYGSSENLDVFSHEPPPIGTLAIYYKGRMFIGGDQAYSATSLVFTNGSTSVTGTGFSTKWAGRALKAAGDTVAYLISAATSTTLTLAVAYGGTSNTKNASIFSPNPNRIAYSRSLLPESFYAGVQERDVLQGRSDQLVAWIGREDGLYLFGKYSSERLVFNSDPAAILRDGSVGGAVLPIKGNRGAFNQRCLCEVDGRIFSWDRQGVYEVGPRPEHVSGPIDDFLVEEADFSLSDKFHAAYDPVDRVLLFFFVRTGDTQPKYAVCMELDTGRWFVDHWLQGITASRIVPTSDGQVRLMLGDESGYSWFLGVEGSFDGVPPASSTVLTATGTPTTTVISVTQTLPTSPSLAGALLYQPSSGEAKTIASNTASQITLASALSAAPVASDTLFVGAIPWEYRTKWWTGRGLQNKKRPTHLHIHMYPGNATGQLYVYFYEDFSASPTDLSTTSGTYTWPDGVTLDTTTNTRFIVDLDGGSGDGYVAVPCPANWRRSIQARLTAIRPDGDIRILHIGFELLRGQEEDAHGE